MVNCVDENIWYKRKRKKRRKKRRFFIIIILVIIIFCICYYKNVVANNIADIFAEYSYSYATECANKAILMSMQEKTNYKDYVEISKNESGDINLISTNSIKVNETSRIIVENTKKLLVDKIDNGVKIPVFAFSGIKAISGYGIPIHFDSLAISSVECDIKSEFVGVGINQTLHRLFFEVSTSIVIEAPAKKRVETIITPVLVSESIIVGKVPEIYLNK